MIFERSAFAGIPSYLVCLVLLGVFYFGFAQMGGVQGMRSNTIQTEVGVEVYQSEIQRLADEYIGTLDEPEDISNKGKSIFTGLVKYIYINYFSIYPLNYDDIDTIYSVWNIYTSLCYKYNKRPTILNFAMMVGMSRDTITDWARGNSRASSPKHSHTAKKMLQECESTLVDGAVEQNSIGCIFALKCDYGYTETAPVPTVNKAQQVLGVEELPKLGELAESTQNPQSIVQYDDIFNGDDTT